MRHLVAPFAAILAISFVFASPGNPALAALSGDPPHIPLALQEQPPTSNSFAGLVASASAGARH